jgi:sigma-B regulation protein RsbU (phosphoserine phosphatase)
MTLMTTRLSERRHTLERSIRIPATPDAPRRGRQALDGWLPHLVAPARADDARLIATELMSNAVRHGGISAQDDITLSLGTHNGTVKIVVEQPTSAASARIADPSTEREGGFGLLLVDRLADSWGVEHGRPGRVWFAIMGPEPLA